jgi:hypothetical protein
MSRACAPFRKARNIAAIPAATRDRKKLRSPVSAIILPARSPKTGDSGKPQITKASVNELDDSRAEAFLLA